MFSKYFCYKIFKKNSDLSNLNKFSFYKNKAKTPFNYILFFFVILFLTNYTNANNPNYINISSNCCVYSYLILS